MGSDPPSGMAMEHLPHGTIHIRGLCPGDKILSGKHPTWAPTIPSCVTPWKMFSIEQLLQPHNSEGPRLGELQSLPEALLVREERKVRYDDVG